MKKRTSNAFNKKIYLLGSDSEGQNYWLEEATWDCGWYWGFGYIKTYTNNKNPGIAKDIRSHEHAENFYGKWWNSDNARLVKMTFSESEGWELAELLKQFYLLKECAEYFKNGKSNMSSTTIEVYAKPELVKEINEVRLPKIFNRIYKILIPKA